MSGGEPGGIIAGAIAAITLRMYAERKGWPLARVEVALTYGARDDAPVITRRLRLEGLDAAQRARCAEIAEKTPVTRALKRGIAIETTLIAPA